MEFRLKYLREKAGLSQDDLAKMISCAQQTIGSYEIGRTQPDFETLYNKLDSKDENYSKIYKIKEKSLKYKKEVYISILLIVIPLLSICIGLYKRIGKCKEKGTMGSVDL